MVVEFHGPRPLLNVPEHTRHVAGRGDDLPVVYEAAAAEVPGVCAELSGDLDLPARRARRARPRSAQGVDGADVVEATAGDEVPGGGIGGGHDPGGAEWDGVDLVGGVGVPDDELAVLGGGDDVAGVGGPVEGVDLGEVALERAAGLEGDAGEGGRVRRHRAHWLSAGGAGGDSRLVSAGWSRAARSLSFRPSASRRAAAILSWMSCMGGDYEGGATEEWQREIHLWGRLDAEGWRPVRIPLYLVPAIQQSTHPLCISTRYIQYTIVCPRSQLGTPVKPASQSPRNTQHTKTYHNLAALQILTPVADLVRHSSFHLQHPYLVLAVLKLADHSNKRLFHRTNVLRVCVQALLSL